MTPTSADQTSAYIKRPRLQGSSYLAAHDWRLVLARGLFLALAFRRQVFSPSSSIA